MPFARSTLTQLRAAVRADIDVALPGVLLRFANLRVLGDVLAKLTNGLYGYLDWIALQAVPFTATGVYLEGWAALKGVTRAAAAPATGTVVFPAAAGAVVPAGTPATRADGLQFVSTADAATVGASVAVPMLAVVGGVAGNAAAGVPVTLAVGIAGVGSTGTATTPFTGGADAEGDGSLRTRMLAAYAAPAQGGAAADYVDWALAVPGVTRAWCVPNGMGAGTVSVFFMLDQAEAGQGGFPQGTNGVAADEPRGAPATGDQLAVANAILPLQPVTALVYAVAPQPNAIDLTIAGPPGASQATQAAITAAVAAAIARGSAPGGLTDISAIQFAVASLPAAAGFVITNVSAVAGMVSPGPAGNIRSNSGFLAVLGTITWA